MVRVAIIATIRLYREGLALVLARDNSVVVAGAWESIAAARVGLLEHPADVVLLDFTTPGALEGAQSLVQTVGLQVVALGVADVPTEVLACAEAGIVGYLRHAASLEELQACLGSVARGEVACSRHMAGTILRHLAGRTADRVGVVPRLEISNRERVVLELVDRGLSNKEIAAQLTIEVATVKNHVHSILEKLRVKRRSEAAALFRRFSRTSAKTTI